MNINSDNVLMKVDKSLRPLHGFSFADDDVIEVTEMPLFMTMKKITTIIGTKTAFVGIGFAYMKNGTASNTNTVWSLKIVQLAPSHPVDAGATFP